MITFPFGRTPPQRPAAEPPRVDVPPPSAPLAPLQHHDKARLRVAVHRAKQLYPAPVARLIERELMTWEEFGWRLDMHGEVAGLVHHLTTAPLP